jgi:hypothetical protein
MQQLLLMVMVTAMVSKGTCTASLAMMLEEQGIRLLVAAAALSRVVR